MAEPSSDWQHTLIPLESAINRQADANLKAPFVRLWQAFLSGRVLLAVALLLLQTLHLQLQKISSPWSGWSASLIWH